MRSRGASIVIEPCHPRLPVENRARLATAPPGIANDIKEKSAPEDAPLARNPNLEPMLTVIACCPRWAR